MAINTYLNQINWNQVSKRSDLAKQATALFNKAVSASTPDGAMEFYRAGVVVAVMHTNVTETGQTIDARQVDRLIAQYPDIQASLDRMTADPARYEQSIRDNAAAAMTNIGVDAMNDGAEVAAGRAKITSLADKIASL